MLHVRRMLKMKRVLLLLTVIALIAAYLGTRSLLLDLRPSVGADPRSLHSHSRVEPNLVLFVPNDKKQIKEFYFTRDKPEVTLTKLKADIVKNHDDKMYGMNSEKEGKLGSTESADYETQGKIPAEESSFNGESSESSDDSADSADSADDVSVPMSPTQKETLAFVHANPTKPRHYKLKTTEPSHDKVKVFRPKHVDSSIVVENTSASNIDLENLISSKTIKGDKSANVSLKEGSMLKQFFKENTKQGESPNELEEILKGLDLPKSDDREHGILKQLLNDGAAKDVDFPVTSDCPFMSVRKPGHAIPTESTNCTPYPQSVKDCQLAESKYNTSESNTSSCPPPQYNNMCKFVNKFRLHAGDPAEALCETSMCSASIYVISMDPKNGLAQGNQTWRQFVSTRDLEKGLPEIVERDSANGFDFCFLMCIDHNKTEIKQLLAFPPIIQKQITKNSNININVVVLDSVSRRHFYRSLPQSVSALRKVVYDTSIKSTVLDFEFLQSIAPFTFHNIRTFVSGKTDFNFTEHVDQHYGIEVLYNAFKKMGYRTLLQEDSCWYDPWGSLFTDNVHNTKPLKTAHDFAERWTEFQKKISSYSIDDLGLTLTTCEVLGKYGVTNQFNDPKKVCWGGRPFSHYFLNHTLSIYRGMRKARNTAPLLSYTHLNAGHEVSGTRIQQIDDSLYNYILEMSRDEKTLTMIFSDHGPKTTPFSQKYLQGRLEIYDSFLFMIVPEAVAGVLGTHQMKSLITNQNRLLSTLDLHNALMSLVKKDVQRGVFDVIPGNRSCSDLCLISYAMCKCQGWERFLPDDNPDVAWLAEFALGSLNNMIQKQFLNNAKNSGGFGNCQKLRGKSFNNIRQRNLGDNILTTFDLKTRPYSEIFEIQITHPVHASKTNPNIRLVKWRRVSIYRHYSRCVDSSVDIELCVCNFRKPLKRWKLTVEGVRMLSKRADFGRTVTTVYPDNKCLILSKRTFVNTSSSYEISNACNHQIIVFTINATGHVITTAKLPLTIKLFPRTMHFLFSVHRYGTKDISIHTKFESIPVNARRRRRRM